MIEIISWNIQWGRGADGAVDMSRLIEELHRLGEFDLICLQEVASRFPGLKGGHGEDGIAILQAAFPDHALVAAEAVDRPHPEGGRSRFGNLVLSRLPVGAVVRHRLPWPPEPKRPSMPRSAVELVVTQPGGAPLRIITTHLEYYSAIQRAAQVDYLVARQREAIEWAAIKAHPKDRGGPFARPAWPVAAVLCGDFNFTPGSDDWVAMTAGGFWVDGWSHCHPDQPHPPSAGIHGAEWPEHPLCCDFAFVSGAALGAVVDVRYDASSAASDHQPVVLRLDERALGGA